MDYLENTGVVIVLTHICKSAVALGHIHDSYTIGEATDGNRLCCAIYPAHLHEVHL